MTQSPTFALPFLESGRAPVVPARRLGDLHAARIALVDNMRMTVSPYDAIPRQIHADWPIKDGMRWQCNLMTASHDDLRELAARIASSGAEGAILGLAEAGVTQPTIMLAVELEARGVATVTLCCEPGTQLARTIGAQVDGGLNLVDLRVKPFHRPDEVAEAVTRNRPMIARGLQQPSSSDPEAMQLIPDVEQVRTAWRTALMQADAGRAAHDFLSACERFGIGDGLPLVPPTLAMVEEMQEQCALDVDAILVPALPPSNIAITVRLAAVNAVMAGCRPAAFPVIVAALQAMAAQPFRLGQAAITTHPSATLIIVSGPLAERAGITSGTGSLGPGMRGNLTVGRAVNLCLINTLRSIPGYTDLGSQGSVAELGICFADRQQGSWQALHAALGHEEASTVTVHRCAAPHNALDHRSRTAESLLGGLVAASTSLASNNAWCPSELVLILSPDHADILQRGGMTREDVQAWIWQHARNPRHALDGRGLTPSWPASFDAEAMVPVMRGPDDVLITISGGAGPHSQVAVPWGLSRASTVAVAN